MAVVPHTHTPVPHTVVFTDLFCAWIFVCRHAFIRRKTRTRASFRGCPRECLRSSILDIDPSFPPHLLSLLSFYYLCRSTRHHQHRRHDDKLFLFFSFVLSFTRGGGALSSPRAGQVSDAGQRQMQRCRKGRVRAPTSKTVTWQTILFCFFWAHICSASSQA